MEKEKVSLRFIAGWAIVISIIAVVACFIVNYINDKAFSWAVVVMYSVILGWFIILPPMSMGKHGIKHSLGLISVAIAPYLFVVGVITNTGEIVIWGTPIAALIVVFSWVTYVIIYKAWDRKLFAGALILVTLAVFKIILEVSVKSVLGVYSLSIWDSLSVICMLLVALALFIANIMK